MKESINSLFGFTVILWGMCSTSANKDFDDKVTLDVSIDESGDNDPFVNLALGTSNENTVAEHPGHLVQVQLSKEQLKLVIAALKQSLNTLENQ